MAGTFSKTLAYKCSPGKLHKDTSVSDCVCVCVHTLARARSNTMVLPPSL